MTSSDTHNRNRKRRWLRPVLVVVALLILGGGYWYFTEGWAWLYGTEAYIYGFPMIMMDLTKDAGTATSTPGEITAPVNQFSVMTHYPDASFQPLPEPGSTRYLPFPGWISIRSPWSSLFQIPTDATTSSRFSTCGATFSRPSANVPRALAPQTF